MYIHTPRQTHMNATSFLVAILGVTCVCGDGACVCACVNEHVHICTYMYMYIRIYTIYIHIYTYIYICIHIYIHKCLDVYMNANNLFVVFFGCAHICDHGTHFRRQIVRRAAYRFHGMPSRCI